MDVMDVAFPNGEKCPEDMNMGDAYVVHNSGLYQKPDAVVNELKLLKGGCSRS